MATPSHAAIISWNAGDGSWYDAGNWSPNVIPDSDDVVSSNALANGTRPMKGISAY